MSLLSYSPPFPPSRTVVTAGQRRWAIRHGARLGDRRRSLTLTRVE